MKYAVLAATYLLGLVYTVFGLNFFLHFIPMPEMSGNPATFMSVMAPTGYMMIVKVLEIAIGLCILIGIQRPLMYLLIMPISINILLFEICIAGAPGIGVLIVAINAFLIWSNRERYMPIVQG